MVAPFGQLQQEKMSRHRELRDQLRQAVRSDSDGDCDDKEEHRLATWLESQKNKYYMCAADVTQIKIDTLSGMDSIELEPPEYLKRVVQTHCDPCQ